MLLAVAEGAADIAGEGEGGGVAVGQGLFLDDDRAGSGQSLPPSVIVQPSELIMLARAASPKQ